MPELSCATCGKRFHISPWRDKRAQYCSQKCYPHRKGTRRIFRRPIPCLACRKAFEPASGQKRRKFCSLRCAYSVRHKASKPCPICARPFVPRGKQQSCSVACKSRAQRTVAPKICAHCQKPFDHRRDGLKRQYCGRACSDAASWKTIDQAFWAHVEKTETCWLWTAGLDRDGYGYGNFRGKRFRAHRFSYELLIGPIPKRREPDHLCRVRHCVRPDHMEPVTQQENQRRGKSLYGKRLRQRAQTRCKRGHPFDRKNTYNSTDGSRQCRTCRRECARAWFLAHRALKSHRL